MDARRESPGSIAPGPGATTEDWRYRLLVDSVKEYAIFMLDTGGHIVSWNNGAQAIYGYCIEQILGQHFSVFYTSEARAAGRPGELLRLVEREGAVEDEGWRVRRDGSSFWASATITAVYDEAGALQGYAKVTRDMSERKRLEELEHSSRRMSEFLAMLGHELRSPLAPIRNAVSVMQLEPVVSPTVKSCRDLIDRQLSHLTRLVDDLLDIGRITAGKVVLHKTALDLADVIVRGIEATKPMFDSRQQQLGVSLGSEPVFVSGDLTRLVQVLQNLLHNAAKFTPIGGYIMVSLDREDRCAVVRVKDNGRGMSPRALCEVFDLFMQEDAAANPSDSGLGIGLTLARSLVEMHGGTIGATSPGRDQGSVFTVMLPLLPRQHAGERTAPVQGSSAPARRVLVVDDNRDSADSMAMMIRAMGHEAVAAYDGNAALVAAERHHPHLVLLDLAMPGLDGYQLLQRLCASEAAGTRIVAVTGFGRDDDRRRSAEAGFDEHLVKPVAPAALQRLLAELAKPERG
jgi:PAS domain S-box-containing protein